MSLKTFSRYLTNNLTGLFRRKTKLILDSKIVRKLSLESEDAPHAAETKIGKTQVASLLQQISKIYYLDDEYVIEIGCGDGTVSTREIFYALEPVWNYTAIDIDPSNIEYCRKAHKDCPISFFVADITDEKTIREKWLHYFTVALSLNVMGCVNEQLALQNIHRMLQREGMYVFSWCSPEDCFNILREMKNEGRISDELLPVPESLPECSVMENQQLELAKKTNFAVAALDVSNTSFSFENEKVVRDYFSGTRFFSALPPPMREQFFDQFIEEYRKRYGNTISLRSVTGTFRKA